MLENGCVGKFRFPPPSSLPPLIKIADVTCSPADRYLSLSLLCAVPVGKKGPPGGQKMGYMGYDEVQCTSNYIACGKLT